MRQNAIDAQTTDDMVEGLEVSFAQDRACNAAAIKGVEQHDDDSQQDAMIKDCIDADGKVDVAEEAFPHKKWFDIEVFEGLGVFEDCEEDGEDRIILHGVTLKDMESGADALFQKLPPSRRRELIFQTRLSMTSTEKRTTQSKEGLKNKRGSIASSVELLCFFF